MFPTPIGTCGVAWTERGLAAIQLPEASEKTTLARLRAATQLAGPEGHADGAPTWVMRAVDRIHRHLEGHEVDLETIPLDMDDLPAFHRKVYEAARRVRRGNTCTYGESAAVAGAPGGARAAGQALAKNPFPIVVPCHRVIAAGGRPGGFSARGGLDTKARLLAIEGASLRR